MSDDYKDLDNNELLSDDLPENPEDWDDDLSSDEDMDLDSEMEDMDDLDDMDEMDEEFEDNEDDQPESDDSKETIQSPEDKKKKLMLLAGLGVVGVGVIGGGAYKTFVLDAQSAPTPAVAPKLVKPAQPAQPAKAPEPVVAASEKSHVPLVATSDQDPNSGVKAALMAKVAAKKADAEVQKPVVTSSSVEQSTPVIAVAVEKPAMAQVPEKPMSFQEKLESQKATQKPQVSVDSQATIMTEERVRDIVKDELNVFKKSENEFSARMSESIAKLNKGVMVAIANVKKNEAAIEELSEKSSTTINTEATKPAEHLKRANGFNVINATAEGNMAVIMTPSRRIIVVFEGERVRINDKVEIVTEIKDGGYQVVFGNKYYVDRDRVEVKKKEAPKAKVKKSEPKKVSKAVERTAFHDVKLAMLLDKNSYVVETANGDFIKVKTNEKIKGYEHLGYVKGYNQGSKPGLTGTLIVGDNYFLNTSN